MLELSKTFLDVQNNSLNFGHRKNTSGLLKSVVGRSEKSFLDIHVRAAAIDLMVGVKF